MQKKGRGLKRRVTLDFKATLNTFIRSSSQEEISIINAFEKPEDRKDFHIVEDNNTLKPLKKSQSIYRNQSFKKYELVVENDVKSGENNEITGNKILETKISARPIIKTELSLEKNKKNKPKPVNYIQRFFPSFNAGNVPFESTRIKSLPYHLHVYIEGKEKILITVTEFYKINKIKYKIFKRTKIPIEQQAIFYKEKRLEGENMLYKYDIRSHSKLYMKICESINIIGKSTFRKFPLTIFTSATIFEIKESFAKIIGNITFSAIELRYNSLLLEENNEVFIYNIQNDSEIEIILLGRRESIMKSPGYQVVHNFFRMTSDLTKCNCRELRLQTIVNIFLLTLENKPSEEELKKNDDFLRKFDANRKYHHCECFKIPSSPIGETSDGELSRCSSVSKLSTRYSGSENSLKSAVLLESKEVDKRMSFVMEDDYIYMLAKSKDFKVFKHLLKEKVGTKCTLRSVALLYKYARATIRFIEFDEKENNPEVEKILKFTNIYFNKYFQEDIIKRGGMDALTLSTSEID